MDETQAINGLTALAQSTRLRAFQHLIAAYPESVPAGEVARLCDVPHNTMSTHLAILARAGMVAAERQGRVIAYRAGADGLRELVLFLMRDCCRGRADICAPLIAALACCPTSDARESRRA